MSTEVKKEIELEIAYVLFIDIVGYSKLVTHEQRRLLELLNQIVRQAEHFRAAEAKSRLITVPTGDGMALVFYNTPQAPVECALEISNAASEHPELKLRMGIHSGPVSGVVDLSGRSNIAGAGINIAQRVMDCGDASHILISKHLAEDVEQYGDWKRHLHDLGECEVKHGVRVSVVNLYTEDVGNPEVPQKFREARHKAAVPIEERRGGPKTWITAAAVAILAALASGGLLLLRHSTSVANRATTAPAPAASTAPSIPGKSIAVLPFENLSSDKENSYFADGIQDEILARLSKIADLKVISRTSTEKYKSAPSNLREIAQQLGVANILEGSVQKAGDQVRITVQLINALKDNHLWAETYDRQMTNIFGVESDVAQKVAESLEAKLTGREKKQIAFVGTKNPAAYDAFLHAAALRGSQGGEAAEKRRNFLRRAVELDPNYAQGWATLAMEEAEFYFSFPSEAGKERVRTAAESALRLAPDLPQAQAAMGVFKYHCLQDYDAAITDLEAAREHAPNDGAILAYIGFVRRRQGNIDQCLAALQQAAILDPLNEDIVANIARTYRGMRKFEEARAMLDRALTIAPNDPNIMAGKAETYVAQGDLDTAWGIISKTKLSPGDPNFPIYMDILAKRRQFDEMMLQLRAILDKEQNYPPFLQKIAHAGMAILYLIKDERAAALPYVEQARRDREESQKEGATPLYWVYIEMEARLGNRAEVEREIQELFEETRKDNWAFPRSETTAASGYALLGDLDKALPLLQDALFKPSELGLTPADLRLDPVWDGVRSDPRFHKLCEDKPK